MVRAVPAGVTAAAEFAQSERSEAGALGVGGPEIVDPDHIPGWKMFFARCLRLCHRPLLPLLDHNPAFGCEGRPSATRLRWYSEARYSPHPTLPETLSPSPRIYGFVIREKPQSTSGQTKGEGVFHVPFSVP